MKKLVTISVILFGVQCNAQIIPNGGFEDWSIPPQTSYEDPTNWITLNILNFFGVPVTTEKSTDAHGGNYAARCKTVEADLDLNGSVDDTIAGMMTIGTTTGQDTHEGFPINTRPDSLIAWIKYTPGLGDAYAASVTLTKWDTASGMQSTIASGQVISGATYSNYTRVAIAITYNSNEVPDTAKLTFTCSANEPALGSELWVDDVAFTTASVAELANLDETVSLSIYPNPGNDFLTVTSTQNTTISVFNALGELIESQLVLAGKPTTIITSNYSSGVYFLKTEAGLSERFVIQHQ